MKAKKMFSAMMAGAMALSLVACGGSSASSSTAASSATQDTAATSTADSAPVNIVWAGWSGEEEASKDIFQRMMKTYEDLKHLATTFLWALSRLITLSIS